jgi:hypothetical protein
MIPRKNVTEEDLKATEARLNASFNGFKGALLNIPAEAAKPVTEKVKAHPFLTIVAAASVGFALYKLLDVLIPRTKVVNREIKVQPQVEVREEYTPSLASTLRSEAISMATPYIKSFLQNELSRIVSKPPEEKEEIKG